MSAYDLGFWVTVVYFIGLGLAITRAGMRLATFGRREWVVTALFVILYVGSLSWVAPLGNPFMLKDLAVSSFVVLGAAALGVYADLMLFEHFENQS